MFDNAPTRTRALTLQAAFVALALVSHGTVQAQRWWGWGGYHASTPFEGYARGLADFTRSTGEANLYNSRAAINFEQARSANFDNRLKYAQMYFERRRLHDEYMKQQQTQGRYDREMYSRHVPLEPLTQAELDPRTGHIHWPDTLRTAPLSESRERLEELAELRSKQGPLTFSERNAVRREAKAMTRELREQVASYTANDYAQARRFIERLDAELRTLPAAATARVTSARDVGLVALAMDDVDKLVARD